MVAASARPVRSEYSEKTNGAHQHLLPQRKIYQIPVPPAHALKLVTVSPFHKRHVLFRLLPLGWESE